MQRRKFIGLSATPILGTLLAACGGSDDSLPLEGDQIIEPGLDLSELANTPAPINIDFGFLQEQVGGHIQVSVMLGEQVQAGVPVTLYDVTGTVLSTETTDAQGKIQTNIKARRLVVAEATTPHGLLRGMHFYSGDEFMPTLYIDLLQSLFVDVLVKTVGHYNVGMYILQDYFMVPHRMNVLNIGHAEPSLDQRLAYTEWKQSNQSLNQYIDSLSQDVIDHLDDYSYSNLRFNAHHQPNNKNIKNSELQSIEEDIVATAADIAIEIIGKASPIPFTSELLKFAFGQFSSRIFPSGPDPFVEIQQRLIAIEAKLKALDEFMHENAWSVERKNIASHFSDFVNVKSAMESLRRYCIENPDDTDSPMHKNYTDSLLEISNGLKFENKLKTATRRLLGRDEFKENASIDILLKYIQNKKFYSKTAEYSYRGYLAYFLTYQSMGYMLLASSYILRGVQKTVSEDDVKKYLKYILIELKTAVSTIAKLDVKPLPDRVNIDHKNKLAWIGSCGLIPNAIDFWPPSRKTCSSVRITVNPVTNTPVYYCRASDFGKGLNSWNGPDPAREMLRASARVNEKTRLFGPWRSPSEKEFKISFYTDAKNAKQLLDVYADENGFTCSDSATGTRLNAFNNYLLPSDIYRDEYALPEMFYRDGLAEVPTQYRRAGYAGSNGANYYIDCTRFNLKNYAVDSRNVRNNYGMMKTIAIFNPSRYVFFPTCSISENMFVTYVPWSHINDLRAKEPL